MLLQYHKLFAQSCFTGLESVKLCSGAVNFLLKETKFFKAHFGGRRGELEWCFHSIILCKNTTYSQYYGTYTIKTKNMT